MISLKCDRNRRNIVPTMTDSKQKRPVYNFSTKDHFNLPYINRYMVNSVDGINTEVLVGCVYESIV